jgi:predicted NACHT family NTPase
MKAKHHDSHMRQTLLKRVRTMWLKDMLEPSLNETKRIPLKLQEWRTIDGQECWSQGKPLMLPADINIADLYERNRWELLISGAPGSGKTTLLLELLRTMVDRAEQDEFHPIPVMFHLSSWATQRLPFEQCLVEALKQRYQIPRQCGRSWVSNQQLALLLDGLDEVAEDAREGCVLAINAYREAYGSGSIIVSSST